MVALYVQETHGFGQFVDVSMHAACNVTTEAATYEWLVAQATVQRQTFRHAAVRTTPQRMMPSVDGNTVIGGPATARRRIPGAARVDDRARVGRRSLTSSSSSSGASNEAVSRSPRSREPEAAAIYQAGADGLRIVAAHLPRQNLLPRGTTAADSSRPAVCGRGCAQRRTLCGPTAFQWRSFTTTWVEPSCIRVRRSGRQLARGGCVDERPILTNMRRHALTREQGRDRISSNSRVDRFGPRHCRTLGRDLGRSGLDLALDAALAAVADAGLQRPDIDGWRRCHSVTGHLRRSSTR